MSWRQFVMELHELEPDVVEDVLAAHGALAVTLTDAGDAPVLEPAPGETPLWPDTKITALFPGDQDLSALTRALEATIAPKPLPATSIEILEERVWEREWLKRFKPMRFGERLWVCPHELSVSDPHAAVVRLDPGLAFGTGTHPTTALCLRWLDSAPLEGARVLDFGSGSGILAIAALKLGATFATAVDIDPQAVTATLSNAAENGVGDRLTVALDDRVRFDVVLANVLAGPLIERAEELSGRLVPGGRLVLSGVLAAQADALRAAYDPWLKLDPPTVSDEWVLLTGTRA